MKKHLIVFFLSIFLFSCEEEILNDKSSTNYTKIDIEVPNYLSKYAELYQQSPREANLKWFIEAKFGLFIHYGLYSYLEKGEWVQLEEPVDFEEYHALKDKFKAEDFNADSITNLMIDAGMNYVTITSKHHDGFCLFNTKTTNYKSLDTPCRRDLIGELVEACNRKGLGIFLYYSYGADWHHPYFYSRETCDDCGARPPYSPMPEAYKFKKDEDFMHYIKYADTHIKEILTQYPTIAGIWFDPIFGYYNRPELFKLDSTYAMIRKLNPHALISFKQGATGTEDFRAPERNATAKKSDKFKAAILPEKLNKDKFVEICNTLQPHKWGYTKKMDGKHKKAKEVIDMLNDAKSKKANLLLNTGPLPDGSIPKEDKHTLREVGVQLKSIN